jgi:outer membrane protein
VSAAFRESKEFSIRMKLTLAAVATLASCFALNAAAQAPAVTAAAAPNVASTPAGPPKIAVIAFQEAVAQTNDFQRRFADLQKKYEPKRDQLKALNDEVASLQKDLQAQSATLADADRAKRAKTLDDKQKQLKRDATDAQNDFQQEMQQTFTTVAEKVGQTMTAYAQEHGFTVVLDGANQQLPVVLYANPSADITKAVVDAYNVKSGVPAPPAPAAAAPGATRIPPAAPKAAPKAPAAH